ncbi:hypothetical protein Hanom_Chr09g00864931 [Helianthus anomalus]
MGSTFKLSHVSTYKEILVEVLLSFDLRPLRANQIVGLTAPSPAPEVLFRLSGQTHAMSLSEFATQCNLYQEAEIATGLYT